MVGRKKKLKICVKVSHEEDRISQLPEHLISEILYHLSIKDAVRTSLLSTKWRYLWQSVPGLELDPYKFSNFIAFVSFVESFFDSHRDSWIRKLRLRFDYRQGMRDISSWIDAVSTRRIQHLDVEYHGYVKTPLSIYTCETLVHLRLCGADLPNAEVVSLPCLKIMHLEYIRYPNDATFERLVSFCPVLEELRICGRARSDAKVFRVLSRSLKKLNIDNVVFPLRDSGLGFVIDAPQLHFLSIDDNLSESFIITNMDSNVKLVLHFVFWPFCLTSQTLRCLRCFLPGISKVRDMFIERDTFQFLCEYSKLEPLPQFSYMSRLQVTLKYAHLKWLPSFLKSFPNLKFLTLLSSYEGVEEMCSEEMNQFNFSHAPQCLLSSLEFVDFKVQIRGLAAEMKLVRYFLENSAILKKLTLPNLQYDALQEDLGKKLLKIQRRSTECKVVFLD